MTVVSCRQLAPRIGDAAFNAELTIAAIRAATDAGAEVVVLPELATSGYVFADRDEVAAAARVPDDALFGAWADAVATTDAVAATGAVVIGGFAERGEGGVLYNSAAVVDGSGVVAIYRKTHLWDRERLWFAAGDDAPPVVETTAGRIGVAICYDLEFPEVTRQLALAGAELIAVPTNWPLVERPSGERPPEVVIAMAAARVNRVAIACCDRTGVERGQRWTEGSTIVGVDGWLLAEAGPGEGEATADIDLTGARVKLLGERNDAFDDRRPELYAGLVDRA
jgi:predicted amidohydrolase